MIIKQDLVTKLYCRSDGAILMPPTGRQYKSFRWTFGSKTPKGYRAVRFQGKYYEVHRIACRAFNGPAPAGKLFVDHINRIPCDNRPENLRWVSNKENCDNQAKVDEALERYGVRCCEDSKAYGRAYCAKMKAQGLAYRKGPNGKWGWYPRVTPMKGAFEE